MNEENPASADPSQSHEPTGPSSESDSGTLRRAEGGIWAKLRLLLLRGAAVIGAFFLMAALLMAVAATYTSRPEFCRSCHNMEPYYASWQESSHKDVSCVKCHFPPGVGEKVRGKMLGLVQLAKYVTSSEGPRPAAEIPDASCLRSGCHETRLLSGRVEFRGIAFDHRPHLEEQRRGKKLRCTSCHSQIVQGKHMTVTTSTCFLCHFKGEHFNEGLGVCTRCHQIPVEDFDLGGGVTFNHELAYDRSVDCVNCHGDLIRGNGEVPQERCTVCHNREDDLKRIDDHEFIHSKHVADHKVDCIECHLEIHHSLDKDRILHAASDCKSCHPDHHHEQVKMLEGIGGKSIPNHTSSMVVARISCPTCHRVMESSPTGTVLWTASIGTCSECHDSSDVERYEVYHKMLRASLSDIESAFSVVREAVESAELDEGRREPLAAELNDIQDDLNFLSVGNGIHNIHYAGALTQAVVDRLFSMGRQLELDLPEVTLPEPTKVEIERPEVTSPDPAKASE